MRKPLQEPISHEEGLLSSLLPLPQTITKFTSHSSLKSSQFFLSPNLHPAASAQATITSPLDYCKSRSLCL